MGTRSLQGSGGESKDYGFIADCGEDAISLKYCCVCNEDLPLYEFHSDANRYDGVNHACRDCRHKHYIENRNEKSEKNKEHYLKNRDKILLRVKEYHLKNRDKILAKMKEYRLKNKH